MHRHASDPVLSEAAQGYLLTLRSMNGAGATSTTSALARRMGVSVQAASEMVGRLTSDGLVNHGSDRALELTVEWRRRGGHDLPQARPAGVAAHARDRPGLGLSLIHI